MSQYDCPHQDRASVLGGVSVASHCCRECWDSRTATLTPYKGKREAWEYSSALDFAPDGRPLMVSTASGPIMYETYCKPQRDGQ